MYLDVTFGPPYHDGEQQLSFFKKVHIKTCRLRKNILLLVMLSFYILHGTKMYYKKQRIPVCLFGESHKTISNALLHMRKVDLDES